MINIDEAIKELEDLTDYIDRFRGRKDADAVKLGIEALKREQKHRQGTFTILLPGETG